MTKHYTDTYRTCIKCKEEKLSTDFYVRNKKTGTHHSTCKECDKARVKARHQANPQRTKNNDLKRTYGITIEEHKKMFQEQNGECAICGCKGDGRWKTLCVDHCHKTGKVRGLLCRSCNTALGQMNDDTSLLEKAVLYLKS